MEQAVHTKVQTRADVEQLIRSHTEEIRSFGIEGISLFGSFSRDTEITDVSDVDFVVDFEPGRTTYDNFAGLADYLEDLLGRDVDLLTRNSLKSESGKRIAERAVRISI
ncbi:MAG: nucleotidyltransferase domain-containing protein [Bacteroidota bacterium]